MKKHWFYRSGNGNCWKHIGFIDRATEIVKQTLVLSGHRNCWKSIGFTDIEAEHKWKTIGFTVKPTPGHRATDTGQRIRGVGFPYSLDDLWGTLTAKLFREIWFTRPSWQIQSILRRAESDYFKGLWLPPCCMAALHGHRQRILKECPGSTT